MATQWATTGAAQGSGDGSSEANRIELKKVIEDDAALASALAAGDLINCKDDGTLTFDGSAGAFATTAIPGTISARIRLQGYTTTAGDGGTITIDDSNSGATNDCFLFGTGDDYWSIEGVNLTNVRGGFVMGTTGGHRFYNVSVDHGTAAISFSRGASTQAPCHYINCYSHGATDGWNDNGRSGTFYNCEVINPSNTGFQLEALIHQGTMFGCIVHSATGAGFQLGGGWALLNCTSNRNGGDGYLFTDVDTPISMINCAATSNTGHALDASSSPTLVFAVNCAFAATNETNSGGKANTNVTLIEFNEVTDDPTFTDGNPGTPADVDLTSPAWVDDGLARHSLSNTTFTPDLGAGDGTPAGGAGGGGGVEPFYIGILPFTSTGDLA